MDLPPPYSVQEPSAPPLDDVEEILGAFHTQRPLFEDNSGWIRPQSPPTVAYITSENLKTLLISFLKSTWLGHDFISSALADFYLDLEPARHLDALVYLPLLGMQTGSISLKESREIQKEQLPNTEKERQKVFGALGAPTNSSFNGKECEKWAKGWTAENIAKAKTLPASTESFKTWNCPAKVNIGRMPISPSKWKVGQVSTPIPNTTVVQVCINCGGNGYKPCNECRSSGREKPCTKCDGDGYVSDPKGKKGRKPCDRCHGNKKKLCSNCEGTGRVSCKICDRSGSTIDMYVLKMTRYVDLSTSFYLKRKDVELALFKTVQIPDLTESHIRAADTEIGLGSMTCLWEAEAGGENENPILLPDLDPRQTGIDMADVMDSLASKITTTRPNSVDDYAIVSSSKMSRNVRHRVWALQGAFHRIECCHNGKNFYVFLTEKAHNDYRIVHVSGYPSGKAYLSLGLTVAGVVGVLGMVGYLFASS
ncbi:hypothetical protein HDU97_000238 [Phlyctochytrium planicorne]|nr:hypothetical protein HDU97_000238 [Phlyctochytrium planicorne]